ncbi:MAG: extracellular solute-binding protein [Planctomycetaceae bacterium]
MNKSGLVLAVVAVALAAVAFAVFEGRDDAAGREPLVVYCAHDVIFSEEILREFEQQTGIPVEPVFDTEATKALGLVNRIIQEQDRPRCDVFWNNQALGTMDLDDHGLLVPYKGPGYQRIPDRYKSSEGTWTGFGARLRVVIVNTDAMPATDEAIDERMQGDLDRMAIAKPLYGTTRSHFTVLWHEMGPQRFQAWHEDLIERGVQVVASNGATKDVVAVGACDFGWTDTDDYFVAKDNGEPVGMRPARVEGRTICIPNTVAIIRGTKRMKEAQRLVEFLLSKETELRMARSKSRQVPLGPVEPSELPEDVRPLHEWAQEGYDLSSLGESRGECLEWLKAEYLK